jgi:hypothetical protein
MRRAITGRLAVASGRRLDGQSAQRLRLDRPQPHRSRQARVKKSLLVDGQGGPLAIFVSAANVNDHFLLNETIEAIVVERLQPTEKEPRHLCLDAGYDNQVTRDTVKEHHNQWHIHPARGEHPSRKVGEISTSSLGRRKYFRTALEMSKPAGAL